MLNFNRSVGVSKLVVSVLKRIALGFNVISFALGRLGLWLVAVRVRVIYYAKIVLNNAAVKRIS